ncbi:MAG: PocR ligand-binding domain-containing protein [Geobacteraceae bacterium]|nr:PocR ligand-binding domain-containing protein [Geobacteraceae bacterium]
MARKKIQILDLIDKEILEEIVQDFTKATQVASVLVDLDGQPITQEHNFTRFCKEYCRSTPEGRARCYASDRFGGEEGKKTDRPFIYQCLNAGLMDSATPIIVEGYHVATLVMGQALTRPLSIEEVVDRAKEIGIQDIGGYLRALQEIPVMSYERLQSVVNLMCTIAKTISSLAIQKYLSQKAYQKNVHNIINSVSEAIISTDTTGNVTLINKATATMLGRDPLSIVGQPIFDLFANPEAFREFLVTRKDPDSYDTPPVFDVLKPNGQIFYAQASCQDIYLTKKQTMGLVIVLRDVTQEKEIEKMKEDLIGMLTHDMGNPILSIQRVLELMLDGHLGSLNERGKDLVSLAVNSTHKLSGMLANFLDIFLDESTGLTLYLVPGNMDSTLVESIQQVGFSADDKKITIHFQPGSAGVCTLADWNRFQRTCVNLLENAIRFSPVGSEIFVKAKQKHSKKQGDFILVTIDDQGKGIDQDKQTVIFEKFYTTSAQDGYVRRGVGLGLTFSKLVVEAHGGEIWVESPYQDDAGAEITGGRFRFRLPVEASGTGSPEEEGP